MYLGLFIAQFARGRDKVRRGEAEESVNDRAERNWRFTVNASKSLNRTKRYDVLFVVRIKFVNAAKLQTICRDAKSGFMYNTLIDK